MTDVIEFDPVDDDRRGRVRRARRAHVRDPGAQGRGRALGARREGTGRVCSRPRPSSSSTASPRSTRKSRGTLRRAGDGRRGRRSRAAVPRPAHRHRLRPRTRRSCCSSCAKHAADEDDEEPPPAARRERRSHRAALRDARADPRDDAPTASPRSTVGRPKCPLCDFPMDPDGHICPRLELTTRERGDGRAGPSRADRRRRRARLLRDGDVDVLGRMPWSSNATFLVNLADRRRRAARDLQAAARRAAAVGLPARHAVPPRGRGVRGVGGARLGHRSRHRVARRSGRRRDDAALRRARSRGALLHAARGSRRRRSGAWPRSTS